ncbi:MAG: hypothetical protein PHS57_06040 [Alphaproteobacteria bacterium]|nr:hypothetical protein [Alphaproteobacteria bacterium]
MFFYILAAIIGIALDRIVVWDKTQAIRRERSYHTRQIDDLKKRLDSANMECYALKKAASGDDSPFSYTNPNFEREFVENGFSKTGIARNTGRA